MRTLRQSWWLALAGTFIIAACGGSKSSLTPTAPSTISSHSVHADSGAIDGAESTATGRGRGSGGGSGNSGGGNGGGNGGGGNSGPGNGNVPPTSTRVELEGLVTSVGAASIAVNTQSVLVTPDTVIRHGSRRFALSDISPGDRVHVKATRTTSTDPGAPATLRADEIKLQNRDEDDDDDDDDDEDDDDDDDDRAVTVIARDAVASETGSNTGTFRLRRDRSNPLTQSPLTVTFTLNGTATNGVDYASVPLTATFPAGEDSIDVVITPITDALVEGAETVLLTLTGAGSYLVGTPATAVIVLNDTP